MTDDCFLSSLLPLLAVAMIMLLSWVMPSAEAAPLEQPPDGERAAVDQPASGVDDRPAPPEGNPATPRWR